MVRERKFSQERLFQATKVLLLEYGLEGFTFAYLAERLEVARGTLYKYYENKEELVTDFMIFEMNRYLADLAKIQEFPDFTSKMDFLFDWMFKDPDIPRLIEMGMQVQVGENQKVLANKEILDALHLKMYQQLQNFIHQGREEKLLKGNLPDSLLLGMIFQTIKIPNHFGIPRSEWIQAIKEIITCGMFIKR
ncbi:TetR/AcrR family transcriptional regulator [Pseudoneobacillus sp. C159]